MTCAKRGAGLAAAVTAAALFLLPAVAFGAGALFGGKNALVGSGNGQMLVKADTVDYDTQSGLMTGRGNVEIDYNGRIVTADQVTYNGNTDIATATGHVVMMLPDGTVGFADHAVLTDQMRNGVLDAFSARLGLYGRFAAVRARREKNGTVLVGSRAAYTHCKICQKENRTPLWQVNAARAVDDDTTHKITFSDAILQLFGIPVAYTPYFSAGDGTVKHETGFLAPLLSTGGLLGQSIKLPYYIAFSDSEDLTIQPFLSTHAGEQLELEYRQRFDRGGMWLQASVANDPNGGLLQNQDQTYSSLFGEGQIWLNDVWHYGYDIQLTSNDTYLQRYSISSDQRLVNDLFLEGISGRSRFEITGYYFQGLLAEDTPRQFPVVLPLIDYTYIPEHDWLGGDFRFDFNTAALTRSSDIVDPFTKQTVEQQDSQRATAEARWKLPLITDNGQLLTIEADVRGDVYHTSNGNPLNAPPGLSSDSQYIYRGLPYVALDWRWPFVSAAGSGFLKSLVIEPIVQGIAAPYGGNPKGIPNDDSQDFELNAMNIFSFDPVPGYDLVETGPRANAGLSTEAYFPDGNAQLIVGQQYRLKADPIFANTIAPNYPGQLPYTNMTGLAGDTSDFVGRLTINFPPHLSFTERLEVTPDFRQTVRNEAYASAIWGHTSLELSYLHVPAAELEEDLPPDAAAQNPPLTPDYNSREEINGQATLGVTDYWILYAAARRDLQTSQMLYSEFGIGYDDECLGMSLAWRRQYVRDRDIPPSSSVELRFTLKTSDSSDDIYDIFPRFIFTEEPL